MQGATIAIATETARRGRVSGDRVRRTGFARSPALPPDASAVDGLAALLWNVADVSDVARAVVADHSTGVVAAASRPDPAALVLFDSGHTDLADTHGADPTSTKEQLIAAAAECSKVDGCERTRPGLDRPWTLVAWREGL